MACFTDLMHNKDLTKYPIIDDETRVVLQTDENNPGDYINANFINVYIYYTSKVPKLP